MGVIRYNAALWIVLLLLVQRAPAGESEVVWSDCVKETIQKNQRVQSAKQAVTKAVYDKKSADSAYLPSVSASGSASLAKSENLHETDSSSYGLSADQLIYDWGRTGAQSKRASTQIESAENRYRLASATVRYRLRNTYIAMIKAQQALEIIKRITDRRQKTAKLIRLRYEAGREHKGSLMTSEAKQSQAEMQQKKAERALELARYSLAVELGRDPIDPASWRNITVKGAMALDEAYVSAPDFDLILKSTPDMKDLLIQSTLAKHDLDAAKSEFYPSISLRAGVGDVSDDWDDYIYGWDARLGVSIPLFEGGRNRARYDSAKVSLVIAAHDEFTGKNDIASEIRRRWNTMQDSIDQMKLAQQFYDAASERAKISQVQYSSGLINYDNWIIIEDDYINSEQSLLDAKSAAMISENEWINVKGGTLEEENK